MDSFIVDEVRAQNKFQHDVEVAAYYLWLDEGCPWGDDSITFANWINGLAQIEDGFKPAPSPTAE